MEKTLVLEAYGSTDVGPHRRSNQDDFMIAELCQTVHIRQAKIPSNEPVVGTDRMLLLLVADGMGGHAGGAVASVSAVNQAVTSLAYVLPRAVGSGRPGDEAILAELRGVVEGADEHVFGESEGVPALAGMGSTLTLAVCTTHRLYLAHAGDSRCYRFRAGKLEQLTTDHTIAGELLRAGVLTPEEADLHRGKHVVTNAIGGGRPGVVVELAALEALPGDILLLCTDGLTGAISVQEIASVLSEKRTPQAMCDRLISSALNQSAKDNVTAIVARLAYK